MDSISKGLKLGQNGKRQSYPKRKVNMNSEKILEKELELSRDIERDRGDGEMLSKVIG